MIIIIIITTNGSPNLSRTYKPGDHQQKEENPQNCGFCRPG